MTHVRVRFAPSPTGPLHIGGLRTALFNFLYAKKHGGTFILRIEDTDQSRYVAEAEDYILESLRWCGIAPDEGVGAGGTTGPYRQSERRELYGAYADQLIHAGHAYIAFDTPEELDQKRKEAEGQKQTFTYDVSTRQGMKNSLTMQEEQVQQLIREGTPYVVRFKFPAGEEILMQDMIRGEVRVDSDTLDDKILFKSDGMPTYHLANVVDDHEMQITHVIRGEEWLPSLPLHVSLYEAFGWKNSMPQFAHLPLILKPDGKGKLSKRDGDKGGFPVFPLEWKDPKSGEVASGYREEGYFPEACINILAFLGWNPGTEKEFYSLEELTRDFDLAQVGKAGAKFDPDKARWFNHHYMQQAPLEELAGSFKEILAQKGVKADPAMVQEVLQLVRERAHFVSELWDQASFFFVAPGTYDEKVVKKRWKESTPDLMLALAEILEQTEPFTAAQIESEVKSAIEAREWGMGAVMNAWRLLLVGAAQGPSLFQMAALLGKAEVLRRIETGIKRLS